MGVIRRVVPLVIPLLLLACGGEDEPPGSQADAGQMMTGGDPPENQELALTNAARADEDLGALVWSDALAAVAEAHSQDMCDRDFFAHVNPDGDDAAARVTEAQIPWNRLAENIAGGNSAPAATHQQWMNSSGHRANILNGQLGKIGIGYVACGGQHLWTQVFTN
jgi:uncharacterized protein YkwD